MIYTVVLVQSDLWVYRHPVTSDENLWSQSISVSWNKTWVFRHPVQSDTFPWFPWCVWLDRLHCICNVSRTKIVRITIEWIRLSTNKRTIPVIYIYHNTHWFLFVYSIDKHPWQRSFGFLRRGSSKRKKDPHQQSEVSSLHVSL